MTASAPLLALDTASSVASVAIGVAGEVVAEESLAQTATSRHLLATIDACLKRGGFARAQLAGVLALRGPGSFTGLRVGLATALAIHDALAIPALAVPTLPVLASCAANGDGRPIVACVDAHRGEWFCQRFADAAAGEASPWRLPTTDPLRLAEADLRRWAPARFVGHGLARLADHTFLDSGEALERLEPLEPVEPMELAEPLELVEPGPLAGVLLRWHARVLPAWNPASLLAPLYLREAATAERAASASAARAARE
jgi:tRNA threonylcarbamoyl adenosine modification protein YeaZ